MLDLCKAMKLTICTPSIPSRVDSHLRKLIERIGSQIEALPNPKDVEHLVLIDNKRRTIGMKRQALLDISSGQYIAFIDDDDTISDNYIFELWSATTQDADVITFKQDVYLNQRGPFRLTFKLGYPTNDPPMTQGFTRPPWHVCAWKASIAKQCRYSDKMYGEDWNWVSEVNKLANTSIHIDKVLCSYHYNDKVTEAK